MKPVALRHALLAALLTLSGAVCAQVPAFPGAEGFGAYASGGRYGDVYHVVNLSSSATTPGSLPYGIKNAPATGRTIVFDVSGHIPVVGNQGTYQPNLTIAGQTAPGDGVGFTNGTFWISHSNVVIRHFRFRNGHNADCIDITAGATNVVIDHCDVLFGTDENLSSFGSPPQNFTFQWSMNAWGIFGHSAGGLWDVNNATAHHTLWAHNKTRDPKARPNGLLDWINNVTYDYGIGFIMADSTATGDWKANVEGCYFACPPSNTRSYILSRASLDPNGNPNFSVWMTNCLFDSDGDTTLDGRVAAWTDVIGNYRRMTNAIPRTNGIPVAQDSPLVAYKKVISAAGPLRLDADHPGGLRDDASAELIKSVVTWRRDAITNVALSGASGGGYGTLLPSTAPPDTDRDGMPDYWEIALGSDDAVDDHTNSVAAGAFLPHVPAGYTLLEEYLHFRATPHAVTGKSVPESISAINVDLSRYVCGFTNRLPVTYTIANLTTGSFTLTGSQLHFEPPLNFVGRASFDFGVTDGDGSSWTQKFLIVVAAEPLPRHLTWKGDGVSNRWNAPATNWLQNGATDVFLPGDHVTFDASGSASPHIMITGTVAPSSVTVDTTGKDYTFIGSGIITGATTVTKRGPGTLTLRTNHTWTGPTDIEEGAIVMGMLGGTNNSTGRIGTGKLTLLNGGSLINALVGVSTPNTISAPIEVPENETGSIVSSRRIKLTGSLTGGGTLTFVNEGTIDDISFAGPASAFVGTMRLVKAATYPGVRGVFNGGSFDGFGGAAIDLGACGLNPITLSTGNTFPIGTLTSTNTDSFLQGGSAGSVHYSIGARNEDSLFAGVISTNSRLTKVGTALLELTGTSTLTGLTTVSSGTLRINGSILKSTVQVNSNAILSGTGILSARLVAQPGGILSPGMESSSAGTLTLGTNASLTAARLHLDLSSSPATNNDRLQLQGGVLALTNTQVFVFQLTDTVLGPGLYTLVSGGTNTAGPAFSATHNLPPATRQTFTLSAPTGQVFLAVTGTAASLAWSGTNSSLWDGATSSNWINVADADAFWNLDAVRFDDSSTNGNVILKDTLIPRSVTVSNLTRAYSFTGGGDLSGPTTLVKQGTNTLTLAPTHLVLTSITASNSPGVVTSTNPPSLIPGLWVSGTGITAQARVASVAGATNLTLSTNATVTGTNSVVYFAKNTFSGGTIIHAGEILLGNITANSWALGTGPVTLRGGTLQLYGHGLPATTNYGTFSNAVNIDTIGTLRMPSSGSLISPFTGTGTVHLVMDSTNFNFGADWSGFTGNILVRPRSGSAELRIGHSAGFATAALTLSNGIAVYPTVGSAVLEIGSLSGASGASLGPGSGGGNGSNPTWRIGGNHYSTTFSGTIANAGLTAVIKTGLGTWTLTGASTYGGDTLVEAGTLLVSNLTGSATGTGTVTVAAGATLAGAGRIAGPVVVEDDATLSPGTSIGTLTLGPSLSLAAESRVVIELDATTKASDRIVCPGLVTFGGQLALTNVSGALAVGDAFQIFTAGVSSGDFDSITGSPGPGLAWKFSPYTGVLRVVPATSPPIPHYEGTISFPWHTELEELLSFPVLVALGTNIPGFQYHTFLSTNGHDLRFKTADGVHDLNYEIEKWNTGGVSYAWVQIPSLTSNTTIRVTWGNAGETNRPFSTTNGSTWANGFLGVWHLTETNGPHRDASPRLATSLVTIAATQGSASGIVAGCDNFAGASQYVSLPNLGTNPAVTVEAWCRLNATPTSADHGVVSSDTWTTGAMHFKVSSVLQLKASLNAAGEVLSPTNTLAVTNWFHGAYTVSGSTSDGLKLYRNGSFIGSASGRADNDLSDINIAREYGGRYLNARIDEVRISSVARSAAWLRTTYRNIASNESFASYGAIVLADANVPPVLAPVASRTLPAGQWLVVTNSATDTNLPVQTLTFSTPVAPSGTTINATNGLLQWRPTVAQAGAPHHFSVVVTDNGIPPMSATQGFVVTIPALTPAVIDQTTFTPAHHFQFRVTGAAGPDYVIEASTNLQSWTNLFTTNSPVLPFIWADTNAFVYPRRFYRLRLFP
jgi:autotransporter-associated beta strand protein